MDRDDGLLRLPRPESLVLAAFLAALAWAPFPYGSNSVWAELALGLGLGAILFAWSGLALTGFAAQPLSLGRVLLPALCMMIALAWAFVQAVDLETVGRLTGVNLHLFADPIWQTASAALGSEAGAYISVDPEATRRSIFTTALAVASFLISFQLGRDRERALLLLSGFVAMAALYAAAAVAGPYVDIDPQQFLLPNMRATGGETTGPFANPHDFAMFLSLAALAGMGLFVETLRQAVPWERGYRIVVRTLMRTFAANAIWLVAIAAILAALLFAQSRSGIVTFLIGALALIVALAAGRRTTAAEADGQRAMAALIVVALGVVVAVSVDVLQGRAGHALDESARVSLTESTLRAIETAPLVGHGFGAFASYYPLLADGSVSGPVETAHSVLETLADLGLPAGLALIAAPLLLAFRCFAGCIQRRRDRLYPAIGFAATVAVAVQALVEFSLQVPAIAVAYAALLGLGVAQSWRTSMDAVR